MTEYTGEKQARYEEYMDVYKTAAAATRCDDGYRYRGYTGANALSLYVDEHYGVNAAESGLAHRALLEVIND